MNAVDFLTLENTNGVEKLMIIYYTLFTTCFM